jgi:hypothetical protein
MLTPQDVINESDVITAINKAVIIMLLKKNVFFQLEVNNSGDTASAKIDAAQGTIKAKMLNALLKLIQNTGNVNVSIRGDEDAVWWNAIENVNEITTEIFFVLYNWNAYLNPEQGSGIGVIPDAGIWGDWAAVSQRPCYTMSSCSACGCTPCSGKLSTCSSKRKPLHWLDIVGCK